MAAADQDVGDAGTGSAKPCVASNASRERSDVGSTEALGHPSDVLADGRTHAPPVSQRVQGPATRTDPWWGVPLRLVILLVVTPYVHLAYRLRGHGRLPFRRGPTVLVSNHQHDLDSVAIVLHVSLRGPWRHPVRSVATQRMFEPGFLSRLFVFFPWRRVNAARFFRLLGILPIENEPLSRTVLSWAHALRCRYGDLPLSTVLTAGERSVFEAVGARRLSDLWSARAFPLAQRSVTHLAFRSPYRHVLSGATRGLIEAQIEAIEAAVRAGATLYLSPEGRYSKDGSLGRLRAVLERVEPLATVVLAAISYDPFVGRRLSLAYRIVEPADPDDLATSLKVARPITVSQLLAAALVDGSLLRFTAPEAEAEVAKRLKGLPSSAYLDPVLAEEGCARVKHALRSMVRRGWLTREGDTYRLGAVRRDARFPEVSDVVAYQARFHSETLAAFALLARREQVGTAHEEQAA